MDNEKELVEQLQKPEAKKLSAKNMKIHNAVMKKVKAEYQRRLDTMNIFFGDMVKRHAVPKVTGRITRKKCHERKIGWKQIGGPHGIFFVIQNGKKIGDALNLATLEVIKTVTEKNKKTNPTQNEAS